MMPQSHDASSPARGPEDLRVTLSRALDRERTRRGWNKTDLANASGLSVATISRIEARKEWPSPSVLEAIAGALGVTPGELFDERLSALSPEDKAAIHHLVSRLLGQR